MTKRTKALQITPAVKARVYARDNGLCILCGAPGDPVAHFVARSHGGLGIEENVVTLCHCCHGAFDQTAQRPELGDAIMEYLRGKYEHWDDVQLTYIKGV